MRANGGMEEARPPADARGRTLLFLALGAYAVLVVLAVVGVRTPALPDPTVPILKNDYGLHMAYARRGAEALRASGFIYGYDPDLLGGQLLTPHTDPSGNAGCYAVAIAPNAWRGFMFNAAVFLHLLALPLAACLGARLSTRRATAAAAAVALAAAAWWTGFGAVCSSGGMYGFGSASVFGATLIFLLGGAPPPGRSKVAVWIAAAGGLALLYHPGALVICAPAGVAFVLLHWRSVTRRRLLVCAAVGAAVLILNSPWLVPWLANRGWLHNADGGGFTKAGGSGLYQARSVTDLIDDLTGYYSRGSILVAGLKVTLFACAVAALRNLERPTQWIVGGSIVWLTFLGFFGGFVPIFRGMQPYRFQAALELLLAGLAGGWIARSAMTTSRRARGVLIALPLLVIAALFGGRHAFPRLRLGVPAEIQEVSTVLRSLPEPGGRVLVQDNAFSARNFETGKYLVNACIDVLTEQPTIAGLFANHHFPGRDAYRFNDDQLFGRAVDEYSADELAHALRIRGISRVVVFSSAAVEAMAGVGLPRADEVGRFVVFENPGVTRALNGAAVDTSLGLVQAQESDIVLLNVFVPAKDGLTTRVIEGLPWPQLVLSPDRPPPELTDLMAPWPGTPHRR